MVSEPEKILNKYNQNVPRYTSYPTAPHFSASVTGELYRKWLESLPENEELSIYLHIPFCKQLCWYCGCHTKITNRYAPIEAYISLLKNEIALVSKTLKSRRRISQIHFGGGSPSIICPEDFTEIIGSLKSNFIINDDANIAIEIDPRNLTEAKVAAYAKSGVKRASLGVQDFNLKVQKAINRIQPFSCVYEAFRLLRDYGINDISIDLIYGLPYQTIEIIQENISNALLLKPCRIALFGYAHVPWIKKHMSLISEDSLSSAAERMEMFQAASLQLLNAKFTAIGLDHFVREDDAMLQSLKNGDLKRNFQGYEVNASETIIGLGASAISTMPQGYSQNYLEIENYSKAINAGNLPTTKGLILNNDDKLRREIINHLMCYLHADISKICREYNANPETFKETFARLQPLMDDNLIAISGYNISIAPNARQIVRVVCSKFDRYFDNTAEKKHSKL